MKSKEILELASTDTQWDVEDMLIVACRYIDNQQSNEAFAAFVRTEREVELDIRNTPGA